MVSDVRHATIAVSRVCEADDCRYHSDRVHLVHTDGACGIRAYCPRCAAHLAAAGEGHTPLEEVVHRV